MTIGNLFDIPLYEDKSIQEGVFYISSPGPLHSLGAKIQEVDLPPPKNLNYH